jgi:hypothetical protein
MSEPLRERSLLPVRRAFVVQFCTDAELERDSFVRRVEYVLSGLVMKFVSLKKLLAFFTRPESL